MQSFTGSVIGSPVDGACVGPDADKSGATGELMLFVNWLQVKKSQCHRSSSHQSVGAAGAAVIATAAATGAGIKGAFLAYQGKLSFTITTGNDPMVRLFQ